MSSCTGGKHSLIEIFRNANYDAPDAKTVVRWCQVCGSIVIDVDVDGRTHPGRVMPMRFPKTNRTQPL